MNLHNILKTLLFLSFISLTFKAYGQSSGSDKLEIKGLEEKYWSVKDDDFSVVQNRTYSKAKRYFLSARLGRLINDGYSDGTVTGISGGYYFTERYGVELSHQSFTTSNNAVVSGFLPFGTYPNFNKPLNNIAVGGIWVPFYAKVNLLDKNILYFDMSVAATLGQNSYEIQTEKGGVIKSAFQYGLDITQTLFLTQSLALRFDIRNKWSTQEQLKYKIQTGAPESERPIGSSVFQDTTMLLGVTYFH